MHPDLDSTNVLQKIPFLLAEFYSAVGLYLPIGDGNRVHALSDLLLVCDHALTYTATDEH